MTKRELIRETAKKAGITRLETEKVVNATLEVIREELKAGGNVTINQFGKFYFREYPERELKTPQGNIVRIDARKIPSFRPGNYFKGYINS